MTTSLEPEIVDLADEHDDIVDRRRKIIAQMIAVGYDRQQMAVKFWNDPTLRLMIPSDTFERAMRLIGQDIYRINQKANSKESTGIARAKYKLRQEMIFKKAWNDANNSEHSEFFRVQSLKIASDASKASAKVDGVDVERPIKIKLDEEWEVVIDEWGNAQRREISEAQDEFVPEEEPVIELTEGAE